MSEGAENRNIIDAIRKICGLDKLGQVKVDICQVKTIDEAGRTITCESIFGDAKVTYENVKLSAEENDGLILIPDKDSTVIILQLQNNACYVIQTSDVSKVICVIDENNSYVFDKTGFVFNKGTLGGLPVSASIVSRLNLLETAVTSLGVTMTPTVLSMIENPKIKQ